MNLALKHKIEALLLVCGEPMTAERLAKITNKKPAEVKATLTELAADFRERGIRVISNGDEWQLGTAAEAADTVEKLIKSEFTEELSKAAAEVLAIIAYKGPITRAEVEYIRGVNSSYSLRNLLLRGLVDRLDNPKDARSYIYRVSMNFMKYLGVEKNEDLPEWETLHAAAVPKPEDGNRAGAEPTGDTSA